MLQLSTAYPGIQYPPRTANQVFSGLGCQAHTPGLLLLLLQLLLLT
jgi:hypothetical protein